MPVRLGPRCYLGGEAAKILASPAEAADPPTVRSAVNHSDFSKPMSVSRANLD
jgi:hypothetical protein